MSTSTHQSHDHDDVEVVVRTPAGASHPFRFDLTELGAQAVATAVAYFVDKAEIETGDYALELIRNGEATPIADTAALGDYDLRNGDHLHLIAEKPQVDG